MQQIKPWSASGCCTSANHSPGCFLNRRFSTCFLRLLPFPQLSADLEFLELLSLMWTPHNIPSFIQNSESLNYLKFLLYYNRHTLWLATPRPWQAVMGCGGPLPSVSCASGWQDSSLISMMARKSRSVGWHYDGVEIVPSLVLTYSSKLCLKNYRS